MREAGRRVRPDETTSRPGLRILGVLVAALLIALAVGGALGLAHRDGEKSGAEPLPGASQTTSASLPASLPASVPSPTSSPPPSVGDSSPDPRAGTPATPGWASTLRSGPWPTSHVQGIAVDKTKGFVYYSFTTLLVKTDLSGKLIGTVGGFSGHLGDLEFSTSDGLVYGSLEYKDARAFYIARFDGDQIVRVGMKAQDSQILSTVYLRTAAADFTADLDENGTFAGDTAKTLDHRYGASGIDGVSFGPKFGQTDGPSYLTVAYGIYQNDTREDNDYQVLLQYDISDWQKFARPLVESRPHRSGPRESAGKYFVYTGNTFYGVQNLEYDAWSRRWLLAVYPGDKAKFPNYALFAIDAAAHPARTRLKGNDGEKGLVLPLATAGLLDKRTQIRGWRRNVGFGFESLGQGLFYVVTSTSAPSSSRASLRLEAWDGDAEEPFKTVKDGHR